MMTLIVTQVSSYCQYGDYHDVNGNEKTGDYYELTVCAADETDCSFKRTATFHFRTQRALSKSKVSASRKGNAIIWTVE